MKTLPHIGERLLKAAELVPFGANIADIGTDHARLPVYLVLSGRAGSAVATDVRPGPLENAAENLERYGCGGKIRLILCDGLSGVRPDEADTIIICGMGGELIAGILEAAPWSRGKRLILQPMSKAEELLAFLYQNGYNVFARLLAREGERLYQIIASEGEGRRAYMPYELFCDGLVLQGSPECADAFLDLQIKRLEDELFGLKMGRISEERGEKIGFLSSALEGLTELKGRVPYGHGFRNI